MLLESTGHIWITEEVNATTDLQKLASIQQNYLIK